MTMSEKEAREVRDRSHNLDLNDPEHNKLYENLLFLVVSLNEAIGGKPNLESYDDGKGYCTIGYGFNMNSAGAEDIWNEVIGNTTSFKEVKEGTESITEDQAFQLYQFIKDQNRKQLQPIYGAAWEKLKVNEKIMIEELYYNGGNRLAGHKTRFYKNIINYTQTSDPKDLQEALREVRERSNRERHTNVGRGIQNRRNVQATIGNSPECPVYSKPNEKPLPDNLQTIQAQVNQTIIPREHENTNENSSLSNQFYIWRTSLDNRVRRSHAANEGKIFDINNPPSTGNPGEEYNCRCSADFYIPDWVEITDPLESKNIIRKHIVSFSEIPNFVIK